MSKLIVDGNEVFPGTITIIDNNSTIIPKDNLRVILNISGESTVTLSDGTDVTQRVEVFNASNDNCTLSYVSSAGNSTTVLAKNTSIRLLWVGTFWDYSDATTVTGIDDNGQPFAYNIDSLVEPKGVINITGKDANGNSFDYGLGKLVLAADEDNYSTSEVKTTKTWIDGKPIYRKTFYFSSLPAAGGNVSTPINISSLNIVTSMRGIINGYIGDSTHYVRHIPYVFSSTDMFEMYLNGTALVLMRGSATTYLVSGNCYITLEYTKTTD